MFTRGNIQKIEAFNLYHFLKTKIYFLSKPQLYWGCVEKILSLDSCFVNLFCSNGYRT